MEPKLSSHNIVTIPHNDELIRIRMSKIAFSFFFILKTHYLQNKIKKTCIY